MEPTVSNNSILYSEGFPLETLLRFYLKHTRRLYINYFEEFKLICDFLAPVSSPRNLYPNSDLNIFVSYETQEIARILRMEPTVLIQVLFRITGVQGYGPTT